MRRKLDIKQHHKVVLPNGKTMHITFINHPGAVIIAPVLSKDKIIILRQFRPALGRYIYELPAGTLDLNENISVCAKRELLEETGYTAKKLKKLGSIYPVPGYSNEVIHIFKAEDLTFKEAAPEEYEVINTNVCSKAQIQRLFKSGKLMDAKSIAALAHIGWL